MVPVISEQNTVFIAAAVIGLEPMLPLMALRWLPVSVIPVLVRMAKLFVVIDSRSTGAGPTPEPPAPVPAPALTVRVRPAAAAAATDAATAASRVALLLLPGAALPPPPPPPPHAARRPVRINVVRRVAGPELFRYVFMCVPFLSTR